MYSNMPKENSNFRYTGVLGARKQFASLGAFMVAVFGVPFIMLIIGQVDLRPTWLFWFFVGGLILGGVLLVGGLFAADIKEE